MSKRLGACDTQLAQEAKRMRVAVPGVSSHLPAHSRMPDELWGLVTRALPLASVVALATCCRTIFAAVRGPHGYPTYVSKAVFFSALHGDHCAVRITHVRVDSMSELRALGLTRRRIVCITLNFNKPIDAVALPAGLQQLHFGDGFNQPVDKLVLPAGLQQLHFGFNFDQPVDKLVLPASLQRLHFGAFDQSVDELVLSADLQQLHFGHWSNQLVDKLVLLAGLQRLYFTCRFNQPVDGLVLPTGLQQLHFGTCFRQPADKLVLPTSLLQLHLGEDYDKPLGLPHHLRVFKGDVEVKLPA